MKALIEIEMDNAAFEENPGELARILRDMAAQVEWVGAGEIGIVPAFDSNGNEVGRLVISEGAD